MGQRECLHLLDRIYLGGPYDLRGFEQNSIGIQTENCSLGGVASFSNVFHIYAPLIPSDTVSFFYFLKLQILFGLAFLLISIILFEFF